MSWRGFLCRACGHYHRLRVVGEEGPDRCERCGAHWAWLLPAMAEEAQRLLSEPAVSGRAP